MAGAIASFSTMAVAGRSLSSELDTFEIMLFRSIVGFILVLSVAGLAGTLRQVETRRLRLHILRNIFHFTGHNLWFFAITVAPLAQVFAIEFSSPIWVALAAPFFLAERLTRIRLLTAFLGFIGILIVARPSLSTVDPGLLAAALAAIGFASTNIITKILTRDQTITCILFWLTGIQTILGLLCAGIDGDIAIPSVELWPWVLLVGLAGLLAHFCLTKALSVAPATIVMPFDFLRLPVIAIVGMLIYGESLDIYVLIGAVIIFGANYLNIWTEKKRHKSNGS